jgi:hypothetical protein
VKAVGRVIVWKLRGGVDNVSYTSVTKEGLVVGGPYVTNVYVIIDFVYGVDSVWSRDWCLRDRVRVAAAQTYGAKTEGLATLSIR